MVFDIQRFIPATSGKMYKQYDFPEHETKVLVEKDVEYIDDNGQKQTRKDMVPLLKTKSVLEFVSLPGGPGTTARPGGWTADQLLDNAETLLQQVIAASSAVTVDEEGADVPLRQLLSDPQFVFAEGMDTVAVKYFATGPDPLTTLYIHVSSGDQLPAGPRSSKVSTTSAVATPARPAGRWRSRTGSPPTSSRPPSDLICPATPRRC